MSYASEGRDPLDEAAATIRADPALWEEAKRLSPRVTASPWIPWLWAVIPVALSVAYLVIGGPERHSVTVVVLGAALFGTLGSYLSSVAQLLGHGQIWSANPRRWSLFRPINGAVLGLLSYLLLTRIGGSFEPARANYSPIVY